MYGLSVWVAEEGRYEDCSVVGVYLTLDAAKAAFPQVKKWTDSDGGVCAAVRHDVYLRRFDVEGAKCTA